MTRHLVINADDFGIDESRTLGILDSIEKGVVTSVSVLANGAVTGTFSPPENIGIGVHVNLTEGHPLTRALTLVTPEGLFWGKQEARRRAARGEFDPREVEEEVRRQIEAVVRKAGRVTHLDGHQHLHIYPGMAEPVARAAQQAGIRWIRAPGEIPAPPGALSSERQAQIAEYRELTRSARPVFEAHGLSSAAFFGSSLTGRWSPDLLASTLHDLREGVSELMVHPGRLDDRDVERHILTAPETRQALEDAGILLTHFGKL